MRWCRLSWLLLFTGNRSETLKEYVSTYTAKQMSMHPTDVELRLPSASARSAVTTRWHYNKGSDFAWCNFVGKFSWNNHCGLLRPLTWLGRDSMCVHVYKWTHHQSKRNFSSMRARKQTLSCLSFIKRSSVNFATNVQILSRTLSKPLVTITSYDEYMTIHNETRAKSNLRKYTGRKQ